MAARIDIQPVRSNAERDAFIKFPWQIYKGDPAWVPPLIIERREFLDRAKHPFYEHGDAGLFLARRDGEIVGRIMASDDPRYNDLHQSNIGCFGLFDCIDDVEVANALFRAAEGWLREKGRSEVMGPIDYSTNYICGLLIDGFEHPPTLLTSHNPPYYQRLVEAAGFSKEIDWYGWWFKDFPEPIKRLRRIAERRKIDERVTIRPFNLKKLADESLRLGAVFNDAWKKNWGFVPFTDAEVQHMAKEMKPIIDPRFTLIAEVDGKPVSFVICVPDINVAFQKIDGRLTKFGFPVGLLKLLYHKNKIKKQRFVALGVVEEFRRAGIAETLVLKIMEAGVQRGYFGELSMTLETNHKINHFVAAIGSRHYKTWRIYRKAIV